jgi:hypothetical protein
MTDAEFIVAFETGQISPASFHHADHLRLALAYLADSDCFDKAAARMAVSLKRFAEAAGVSAKYHHTLTLFWMRAVAGLLDAELPLAYYSRERLFSAEARAGWVEPDLASCPAPTPRRPPSPGRR